jgi:glucosyl-3-phosphoglycerate phosphatase
LVLSREFPSLVFEHLDDPWWYDGIKDARGVSIEPDEIFSSRVMRFRDWLKARPESKIAVVGHGSFLFHLMGRHLGNCENVESREL